MRVITLLLWFIIKSDQMPETEKVKDSSEIFNFMDNIPQVDVLGSIIHILDGVLNETYKNTPPPKSTNCIPKILKIGENELQLSVQPRGFCSYCCRLYKPSRYIRLYFSNKNTTVPIEIRIRNKKDGLRNVGVKANLPTVIYIHGFAEYGLGLSGKHIENAYLALKEDYNIFLVDWGDLCAFPWYPQATIHTKLVGQYLGKFISFYNDTGELPISKIHVIGFSLGAHLAGFIGKYLIEHSYEKLPRITGLDPAFPLFANSERISKEDADFVDVIHTDAGRIGLGVSIGHADFYPNGGSLVQPGCDLTSLADEKMIEQFGYCAHLRAWKFYAESVRNPKAFPSIKVNNMRRRRDGHFRFVPEAFMGFSVSAQTRGDYFLLTNGQVPYSKTAKEQESEMIRE